MQHRASERVERIRREVASWEGVTEAPHRFAGIEFNLGRREIGHVHAGGLVDVPYVRKVRDLLVEEGRAREHHVVPDSGWISFWVRSDADADHAIWLFRLSYLYGLAAGRQRDAETLRREVEGLGLSAGLRAIFDEVLARQEART